MEECSKGLIADRETHSGLRGSGHVFPCPDKRTGRGAQVILALTLGNVHQGQANHHPAETEQPCCGPISSPHFFGAGNTTSQLSVLNPPGDRPAWLRSNLGQTQKTLPGRARTGRKHQGRQGPFLRPGL